MSQGDELVNLVRTAYLRIIPYLEPAAQIALSVTLGALTMGPSGVFPGAAVGVALRSPAVQQWVRTTIIALTGVLIFIQQHPELVQFVRSVLDRLYASFGEHEETINQGNQALEY